MNYCNSLKRKWNEFSMFRIPWTIFSVILQFNKLLRTKTNAFKRKTVVCPRRQYKSGATFCPGNILYLSYFIWFLAGRDKIIECLERHIFAVQHRLPNYDAMRKSVVCAWGWLFIYKCFCFQLLLPPHYREYHRLNIYLCMCKHTHISYIQ